MATHFSILAWKIPRSEELGGLQSMGSQRVRHDLMANTFTFNIYWAPSGKSVAFLDISFPTCKVGIRIPSLQGYCEGLSKLMALQVFCAL